MDSTTESEEIKIFEDYVRDMEKIMDLSVNPSEDFIQYACGRREPLEDLDDVFSTVLQNEEINYPSFVKARNFYKSCKSEKDFKKFLETNGLNEILGTWPAYDKNWKGENFEWMRTVAVLSAMGLYSVLTHEIKFDSDQVTLEVSPKKLEEEEEGNVEDILENLEVCKEDIPDVANDVKSIIEKMKNLPATWKVRSGRLVTREQLITSLGKLKDSKFNYNKYFEICFGRQLSTDVEVYLENNKHLEQFLEIFQTTDSKVVANYIFWQIGKDFLQDKFCTTLLEMYFTPTVIASGFSIYFTANDERKYFEALNRYINSFQKIQTEFSSDADVESDLIDDKEVLKFKNLYFTQEKIDKEYEDLEIDPNNFYQNILNLQKRFPTETQKPCLQKEFDNYQQINETLKFLRHSIPSHNKPILYYISGLILKAWTNTVYLYKIDKESKEFSAAKKCLNEQIIEYNLPDLGAAAAYVIQSAASYPTSLKLALNDYKCWLDENKKLAENQQDILKKSLNLNNLQAFYVSCVQTHLNKGREVPLFLGLLNSKEFSKEFNFEIGSRMNPKIKCCM